MPRQNLRLALLAALVTAVGCREDAPKPATVAQALPGLPLPPAAEVLSRSGSPEALQITFRSALPAERLVEFYRSVLSTGSWDLVSDEQDAEGARVLYAEREGPPIWVRIYKATGAEGSIVEISGAVAKVDAPGDSTTDSTVRLPT